jgi:sec-independent protein translocase protein TatB
MVDISFWELIVIALVALLVIGPERLPAVARTLGHWVGKGRAFVNSVKTDIDNELRLKQLQDIMQTNERNDLHQILEETKDTVQESLNLSRLMDKPSDKDKA